MNPLHFSGAFFFKNKDLSENKVTLATLGQMHQSILDTVNDKFVSTIKPFEFKQAFTSKTLEQLPYKKLNLHNIKLDQRMWDTSKGKTSIKSSMLETVLRYRGRRYHDLQHEIVSITETAFLILLRQKYPKLSFSYALSEHNDYNLAYELPYYEFLLNQKPVKDNGQKFAEDLDRQQAVDKQQPGPSFIQFDKDSPAELPGVVAALTNPDTPYATHQLTTDVFKTIGIVDDNGDLITQ